MASVESMFGPVAAKYAASKVHGNAEELARLVALACPKSSERVLDVATGSGNTAFAFAPHVHAVVAYDITPDMLEQVILGAQERQLGNVTTYLGDACAIPEALGPFDLVVVRLAPHHFHDINGFLDGANRALATGGKLLVSDTATPNDAGLNRQIDEVESLRDPSHVHNLTYAEWAEAFVRHGFEVTHVEERSDWAGEHGDRMDFDTWVERINTPAANRPELRRRFLEADEVLRDGLRIDAIGDRIAFALPRITILGVKR
ncbi:MAG: class I SAM-dependent methyltransferase [Fimbriimonadaceae bacterium]